MTSITCRITCYLVACLSVTGFAQTSILLHSFRNNWIEHDPVREIYQRGMDLIAAQSEIRTADGLLLKSVSWNWDDYNKAWKLSNQLINTYNPGNQLIGDLGQQWIDDTWVDQYRTTYVYNEAGYVRLFQYESWTGSNWELYVRFVHEYDAENRLSIFTAQDWIDHQWVNRYKRIFEYNETFHYVREVRQYWVNDAWTNSVRYGDYYDDHGRLKCNMLYTWDGNDWTYAARNLLDYGCYTLPIQIMRQQYESSTWHDYTTVSLHYNPQEQLISETYHYLDENPDTKDNGWTFEYDDSGNMTERTFWSANEPYWQPLSRDVFAFDEDNRNSSILHQDYIDYWNNGSYTAYEYAKLTGVNPIDFSDQLSLFPNPVTDEIKIVLPELLTGFGSVAIYNTMGEVVFDKQGDLDRSYTVPVATLAPGNYMLRITNNNCTAVKQFSRQ